MKVLVACEESQAVCKAFRAKGHEAYSCDVQECSGGHPEWHICEDVLPLLDGNCDFKTTDGQTHTINGKWDLIIAHPPCTHLSSSGQWAFKKGKDISLKYEGIKFFMKFANADCDKIAIENPIGIMSTEYKNHHKLSNLGSLDIRHRSQLVYGLKAYPYCNRQTLLEKGNLLNG